MITFIIFSVGSILLAGSLLWILWGYSAETPRPGILFEERCGGAVGRLAFSPPLVRVRVTASAVDVSYPFRTLTLPYDRILGVSLARRFLIAGLRIEHDVASYPTDVVVFSRKRERLLEVIRRQLESKVDS